MIARTIRQFFVILLLAVGTVALVQAQGPQKQSPESRAETRVQPVQSQSDYQLSPGDVIKILVFQSPDLTLETQVTEQGTITFPLVGALKIGGMPVAAAEQTIANALRDGGFLKQPHVNIVVMTRLGNAVSVLGQVVKPGRYPLETVNVRVSEMIAVAGGVAPTGGDTAILTGTRDGKPFRYEVDVAGIFLKTGKLENDAIVAPGDVIYVHRVPMFYIYGEVQKPGAYRVERGMTVRQALAQGGGTTARGTERRMGLYRRGGGESVETRTDLSDLVQPNDVFYVKESLF
jgi:polysaccharide export outer membrane protein